MGGGVGSVDAWVRGWRETNFGISRKGCVGPQSFCADQEKWQESKFWCG